MAGSAAWYGGALLSGADNTYHLRRVVRSCKRAVCGQRSSAQRGAGILSQRGQALLLRLASAPLRHCKCSLRGGGALALSI